MARRTSSQRMRSAQRDNNYISNVLGSLLSPLSSVEDGRRWSPDPDPDPVTITGNRTWSVVQMPRLRVHRRSYVARDYYTNIPVGLQVPVGIQRQGMFPVVTCVRRAIRRSVMFATKQTGKGSRARRRSNSRTGVKC